MSDQPTPAGMTMEQLRGILKSVDERAKGWETNRKGTTENGQLYIREDIVLEAMKAADELARRSLTPADAADRIKLLEGALKNAHDVFAAETEALHQQIAKTPASGAMREALDIVIKLAEATHEEYAMRLHFDQPKLAEAAKWELAGYENVIRVLREQPTPAPLDKCPHCAKGVPVKMGQHFLKNGNSSMYSETCTNTAPLDIPVVEGAEENPWKPMQTAPKNGELLDLVYPKPRGRTINCSWSKNLGWVFYTPHWPNGLDGESELLANTYPNMQPLAWMYSPCDPAALPLPSAERRHAKKTVCDSFHGLSQQGLCQNCNWPFTDHPSAAGKDAARAKSVSVAERPKPTHFTIIEGGHWHPWAANMTFKKDDRNFHSIKFEDGSIFDMVNGWRP